MVFWCSYKMKKHTLEALTQDKWNKLIGKLPIGERLNQMFLGLDDGDYSYYAEQNQRLYKVHHREGSSLLNVSQWCGYRQDSWHGDRIEPIVVEDNVGRHNIYAVTFLNNPIAKKKVEKMEMHMVLRNPDYQTGKEEWEQHSGYKVLIPKQEIDRLVEEVTRYGVPSSPLWEDAEISIDLNKNHAELWYGGLDAGWPSNAASREYGLSLYRRVLYVLEQKEGKIHHRGSSFHSPPILDMG